MKKVLLIISILSYIIISCIRNSPKSENRNLTDSVAQTLNVNQNTVNEKFSLIKVKLLDTCLRSIIYKYIDNYHFDNKGVYIVGIDKNQDSLIYELAAEFSEEGIKEVLNSYNSSYYFYFTVNRRPVIVYSKIEESIIPECTIVDGDSLLHPYFTDWNPIHVEVYWIRYIVVNNKIVKEKIIYSNIFQ